MMLNFLCHGLPLKLNGISNAEREVMATESIFISYSRDDYVAVQSIYDKLTKAYYPVWLDLSAIKGGEDWWSAIEEGIQGCDVFITFVSQDWLDSEICQKEFQAALDHEKKHTTSGCPSN